MAEEPGQGGASNGDVTSEMLSVGVHVLRRFIGDDVFLVKYGHVIARAIYVEMRKLDVPDEEIRDRAMKALRALQLGGSGTR